VEEKTWKLWDLNTRQVLYAGKVDETFRADHPFVGPFSPNGQYLPVTARNGTNNITLFDVFKKTPTDYTFQAVPSALAFDPDSRAIALAVAGAEVYDIATHKKSQYWSGGNYISALAFSPDKTRLAVGAGKGILVHWLDPAGHKEPYVAWKAHEEGVATLAFSPDGQMLASGGADAMIKLWDPATGKERAGPLKGHRKLVNTLTFSSSSKLLFSASADDTIRIWQVRE
jgi:WD40 repeat protein